MNAGIPGTGIGGLFYLFNIIGILCIETVLLVMGRSDRERVRVAMRLVPMLGGVILGLLLLDVAVGMIVTSLHLSPNGTEQSTYHVLQFQPILISVIVLLFVLCTVHVWRLLVKRTLSKG